MYEKKQNTLWILKGVALGGALLIPGLSVSTLALLMGVYEKIILSLNNMAMSAKKLKAPSKNDMSFLICLMIGAGMALFLLAQPLSFLLSHFPLPVKAFFVGLIIIGLPFLFKQAHLKRTHCLGLCFLTLLFFWGFQQLNSLQLFSSPQSPLLCLNLSLKQPSCSAFIFYGVWSGAGFLAGFAGFLPGLSGSFFLLIIGAYEPLLMSLAEKEWLNLTFLAIGGVLGLLIAFWIVQFLLKKQKKLFFCVALALIIAGLPQVLPGGSAFSFSQWLQTSWFAGLGALSFLVLNKRWI